MASTGVTRVEGIDPFSAYKAPCEVASTANITLSGAQTVNGVAVAETTPKTRVLVRVQTDPIENGVYDVMGTAWVRSDDFDGTRDIVDGTIIFVNQGTSFTNSWFRIDATDPVTPGTTSVAFSQVNAISTDAPTNFATVLLMTAATDTTAGNLFSTTEHTAGVGAAGSNIYLSRAVTGGTDDNGSLIKSTGNLSIEFVGLFPKTFITPEQFGAPTGGTSDDAVATIAALAFFPTTGGRLQLGPKIYLWEATITLTKRITIQGVGNTQSVGEVAPTRVLKADSLSGDGIKVENDACQLRDFHFRGESGNGGNGVTVEASRFVGRNLTVSHMGACNMRIGADSGSTNSNFWRLDNCYFSSAGTDGLVVEDFIPDVNVGVATQILCKDNGNDGLRIGNSTGSTWLDCTCATNGNVGLRIFGNATGHTIIGGNFENNVTKDIELDANSDHNTLINVRVDYSDIVDAGTENFIIAADTTFDTSRCHVSFDGTGSGTLTQYEDYNVQNVTKTSTGIYVVNIAVDMNSTNYTVSPGVGSKGGAPASLNINVGSLSAGSFELYVTNNSGTATDADYVTATVYGRHV